MPKQTSQYVYLQDDSFLLVIWQMTIRKFSLRSKAERRSCATLCQEKHNSKSEIILQYWLFMANGLLDLAASTS